MNTTWTVILAGLLLSTSIFAPVLSQQQFPNISISIDCGGPGGSDPEFRYVKWETDDNFMGSLEKLKLKGVATSARVKLGDNEAKPRDNTRQLETAMVFIPGVESVSKCCYTLNVSSSLDYLLRVMFPSSNLIAESEAKALNNYGTRFYFTVDSTFVKTIELLPNQPQTVELVWTPLDENIHVCLVPLEDRSSMPAISSIELRSLNRDMYSERNLSTLGRSSEGYSALQSTFLQTVSRLNFGGDFSKPSVRFPQDRFDRLWYPAEIPEARSVDFKPQRRATDSLSETLISTGIFEPVEVMATAWEGVSSSSTISFTFNISEVRSDRAVSTFLINIMFFDVNSNSRNFNDRRSVDISFQDVGSGENISDSTPWASDAEIYRWSGERWGNDRQTFSSDSATFHIQANDNSTLPPMVNALEVYALLEAKTTRTARVDAWLIKNITASFTNQKQIDIDKAGDPCLPVSWAWLVCSLLEMPPRITQLNLTSKGLTGELDTRFGDLDRLTVLDLSNNSFHGRLPPSLNKSVTLRALNIAHNKLYGEFPSFSPKSLKNLKLLSMEHNLLNGTLDSIVSALDETISSLDLSHNQFTGSIPVEIGALKNLQHLDLSFNHLSGTLDTKLVNFSDLRNLYLQNNSLVGMVPDEIWSTSLLLNNVNLASNIFTELNLTTWSQRVLDGKSFGACPQKVHLGQNKIKSVTLTHEGDLGLHIRKTEASLQGFILLGGNPRCKSLELNKKNMTLVQRYLCRSNELDTFWFASDGKGGNDKEVLIISLSSAVLVLLMACILIFFLWRMWRRMHELRQIHQALARDDVRPPFFKYEELKAATGDFSEQNKLGKGGFGDVYKAVLGDGSIVAVKRLLQTEQNVADFLKEVVLITGIKHISLVQLKGCCVRDKHRLLVYEYAESRNLAQAFWGKNRYHTLTWAQRFRICVGVARGLAHLHEELQPKIIHRDIKPENILLYKVLNPKIADFGLARPVTSDVTQMCTQIAGTLGYYSPEYAIAGVLSDKLDVYSYGVLVLEIVSGRKCLDNSLPDKEAYIPTWAMHLYKEDKLLNMAEKGLLATTPGEEILPVLKMALSCVQGKPENRPSMSQVVNMLRGNADVGLEIMKELKGGDQPLSFDDLFDVATMNELNNQQQKETRSLLFSSSATDAPLLIDLGLLHMIPR